MKIKSIIKYIFINIVFCQIGLQTEFGECKVIIDSIDFHNQAYIEKSIISLSDSLIQRYGTIGKKIFTIKFDNQSTRRLPKWSHGITKKNPDTIIMFAPHRNNINKTRFEQVLKHELMHLYLNRKNTNSIFIPRWFREGLSMHESDEFSINRKIILSQGYWSGKLNSLLDLESFKNLTPEQIKLAYSQSIAAFVAFQYLFELNIDSQILNQIQNVNNFEDFFYNITNTTTDEFEILYLEFIEKYYKWFILLKVTNFFMILFPILLIMGYLIKSNYAKKKYLRWEVEEMIEDIDWNNSADG